MSESGYKVYNQDYKIHNYDSLRDEYGGFHQSTHGGSKKKSILRSKMISSNFVSFEIKSDVGLLGSLKSLIGKNDESDCLEYRFYRGKERWFKSKNKKHSKRLFDIALNEALEDEEFAKKYFELKKG